MNREGLYDIHCHLLPGVDDGAKNFRESLKALRQAYGQGIRHIIFTPHYLPGKTNQEPGRYDRILEEVQERAAEEGLAGLSFYLGNEIFYSQETARMAREGKLLTLAGSRYLLIEFAPSIAYGELFQGLSAVIQSGYEPILAHIERYRCLYKKDAYIAEMRNMGVLLQMNAECFGKYFPKPHYGWFCGLIPKGRVQFIATDSHGPVFRPPEIKTAVNWLNRHCSDELARNILYDNPAAVLNDQLI